MNKLITNQTPYYTLQQESMLDFPNEELVEELNLEQTDQMQRQLITKVAVKASLMHKSQLTETITDEVIETHKIIGIEPHQKYLIVDIENTTNDKVFSVKVDLYNEPPFFCKLTLNDGSTVELEGSGELTSQMTSQYQSNLVKAEIGKLCTSIGGAAFVNCRNLTSITIPLSVTTIGDNAFRWCYGLTSIVIPNSVTTIGWSAFIDCTSLISISIPDSVTTIKGSAFYGCTGLKKVNLSNNITEIEESTFNSCSGLTSVIIPNSVTTIGRSAFSGCSGLTSVTIGNLLASIEDCAFNGCTSLTSIIIPNSITNIGNAFMDCTGLTNVTVEAITPPTLSGDAFNNTGSMKIYVPEESVEAYKAASGWRYFSSRIHVIGEVVL